MELHPSIPTSTSVVAVVAEDPLRRVILGRALRQALVDLGRLANGDLSQVHPLLKELKHGRKLILDTDLTKPVVCCENVWKALQLYVTFHGSAG